MRPRISTHDYAWKRDQALEFLRSRDSVKVVVFFRGREREHPEAGRKLLERVCGGRPRRRPPARPGELRGPHDDGDPGAERSHRVTRERRALAMAQHRRRDDRARGSRATQAAPLAPALRGGASRTRSSRASSGCSSSSRRHETHTSPTLDADDGLAALCVPWHEVVAEAVGVLDRPPPRDCAAVRRTALAPAAGVRPLPLARSALDRERPSQRRRRTRRRCASSRPRSGSLRLFSWSASAVHHPQCTGITPSDRACHRAGMWTRAHTSRPRGSCRRARV